MNTMWKHDWYMIGIKLGCEMCRVNPGERNYEIETAVWIYVGNRSLLP
jgi:hypothetical protein